MRRTALMVLRLALTLLAYTTASPSLHALTRTLRPVHPVASALPAHRAAGKSSRRATTHASTRSTAHAGSRASHASTTRRHSTARPASHAAHTTTPSHRLRNYRTRSRRLRPTPSITQTSSIADAAAAAGGEAVARTASLTRRAARVAPMRGSLESLERQNTRADAEGLERIEDEADLADRIAQKVLVPLPASAELSINTDLPEAHRYCRPWTARFLTDIAAAHAAQFHQPLYVSSAVRTVEYQKRLMHINGNAAAAEGDIVSPHLTGATIDIAKSSLGRQQIGWMRSWLLPLQLAGKIDVEEEFHQSCFHITVYNNYVPAHTLGPTMRAKVIQATPDQSAPAQPTPATPDAAPKKPADPKAHPTQSFAAAALPVLGR